MDKHSFLYTLFSISKYFHSFMKYDLQYHDHSIFNLFYCTLSRLLFLFNKYVIIENIGMVTSTKLGNYKKYKKENHKDSAL